MKILTVSIPNHHYFQWVNQLEHAGHEVFWFDVTDGGAHSQKIGWVTQCKGWKLKWDFPLRSRIKKYLPSFYRLLQSVNEREVEIAFAKAYAEIQPDIIHCFEMQLAGLPILSELQKHNKPVVYSSWGSDMFDFKRLGVSQNAVTSFLSRVNYLITDCKRDQEIAYKNGFVGIFLGVFPGNGGIDSNPEYIKDTLARDTIMIKGYDDGVGKASVVLQALTLLDPILLNEKKIIVYSADRCVEQQINSTPALKVLGVQVYSRHTFVQNKELLKMMGAACLHIGNSLSDGMPNALLEAMAMGAFPIQSNPGGATAEVVTHLKNGLLIQNPTDAHEIAQHIAKALQMSQMRVEAQQFNVDFIAKRYNRRILNTQITALYHRIESDRLA